MSHREGLLACNLLQSRSDYKAEDANTQGLEKQLWSRCEEASIWALGGLSRLGEAGP